MEIFFLSPPPPLPFQRRPPTMLLEVAQSRVRES